MSDKKETIYYCYKLSHEGLAQEIGDLLTEDQASNVTGVDNSVGGDHGKGHFCLVINLVVHLASGPYYQNVFNLF